MKKSVCMAVYNGAAHLREQMESILAQLAPADEVIVVDDRSTDESVDILMQFRDPRMRLLLNEVNLGVVRSFERAVRASSGDIVFLADQDDVWLPGKVDSVTRVLLAGPYVAVVTDAIIVDGDNYILEPSFFRFRRTQPGFVANLYRNGYLGCAMAFTAKARSWILPFPAGINMHDEWIGLVCDLLGEVKFMDVPLVAYRRHGANATTMRRFGFGRGLQKRMVHLVAVLVRAAQIRGPWARRRRAVVER